MSQDQASALLKKYIDVSNKAASWVHKSQARCELLQLTLPFSDDAFDAYENLTSRFARLSDILVQKVLRLIDQLSLDPQGTTLDVINRAEKRGIGNATALRRIRELRNAIAHDYTEEELFDLFTQVKISTPTLLEAHAAAINYAENLLAALAQA